MKIFKYHTKVELQKYPHTVESVRRVVFQTEKTAVTTGKWAIDIKVSTPDLKIPKGTVRNQDADIFGGRRKTPAPIQNEPLGEPLKCREGMVLGH